MPDTLDLTAHEIKVLLVDDQPIIGAKLKQMLSTEYGVQFFYCQEAAQAVKMANEVGPTIILQDLVMPDMDGLTLVRYFRANPGTRNVPLIVLSTKEDPQIKAEAFSQGANDYMVKFPDRLEVVARIRYHSTSYINMLQRDEAYGKLSGMVRQERDRNRALSLVNRMNQQLQACTNEAETYKVVEVVLKRLFPQSTGLVGIIKGDGKWVSVTGSWGGDAAPGQEFHFQDCYGLIQSTIYMIGPHEPGALCAHTSGCAQTPAASLCAPLVAQGDPQGLIQVIFPDLGGQTDKEAQGFLEEQKKRLARVSEYYAMTLANMRLRERLRQESIIDPLTRLYNRRHMDTCLQTEIARSTRRKSSFGILFLDIDHFKALNDTYGHEAGDAVLRELGAYLLANVRSEDVVCRYGGEEFMVILPDMTARDLQPISERIRQEIQESVQVEYAERQLRITVSIGAAAYPDNGRLVADLVKAADEALYQAKTSGRDRVVVAPPSCQAAG